MAIKSRNSLCNLNDFRMIPPEMPGCIDSTNDNH
jgi:hypothetical protein